MKKLAVLASVAVLCAGVTRGEESSRPAEGDAALASLKGPIEALPPAKLASREIQWKTCLLEGLQASREQGKPALLWIFIDRPVDDARC
jgi:hypothetical protein